MDNDSNKEQDKSINDADHPKMSREDTNTRRRFSRFLLHRITLLSALLVGAIVLVLFVSPSKHLPKAFGPNKYCEFDTCKNLLTKDDFFASALFSETADKEASAGALKNIAAVAGAVSSLSDAPSALSPEDRARLAAQLPLRDQYLTEANRFLSMQVPTLRAKFNQFPDPKPLLARLKPLEDEARALQSFLQTVKLPVSDQVGGEFIRRRDAVANAYALLLETKTIIVTGSSYQTTLSMEPYSVMLVQVGT